jgi:hypothetical protein
MEEQPQGTIGLEELRRRIARLETGAGRPADGRLVSTGCTVLNRLLPERGFRCGSLVEWLSPGEATGAGTLALLTAREACRGGGLVIVLDRRREFFPPAAVRLGIDPEQLLVVHADNAADHDWAMDQALRSASAAAVLAWPERLDDRTFRRWQLAAQQSGCLGLLLRPEAARNEPSWADARLWVEPLPTACATAGPQAVPSPNLQNALLASKWHTQSSKRRCLRIIVLRCRGGAAGRGLDVEFDDETYRMYPLEERRLQMQLAN